jgi:heme-degrading monooxygenase HmoA
VIAVIFEVRPNEGQTDAYFQTAVDLRPRLEKVDGFVSVERFRSLAAPEKILSLSFFEDEDAVRRWRQTDVHRAAQCAGRDHIFADYRLRVARVLRDYSMLDRHETPPDLLALDRQRPKSKCSGDCA